MPGQTTVLNIEGDWGFVKESLPVLDRTSIEGLLTEAGERSGKYDWMGAADCYVAAIEKLGPNAGAIECSRLTELLARSFFKAAFQAGEREEFKNRMRRSEESYERALVLYEKAGSEALLARCQARRLFSSFWITDDNSERRSLITKSVSLAQKAARMFEAKEGERVLIEGYRDLLTYCIGACSVTAFDSKVVKEQLEMAGPIFERIINGLDGQADGETLVECLVMMTRLYGTYAFDAGLDPELGKRVPEAAERAGEISAKIGTPYALTLAKWASIATPFYEQDTINIFAKALDLTRAAVKAAEPTGDSYLVGSLLSWATERAFWAAGEAEDTDRKRALLEEGIGFGQGAVRNVEITLDGEWLDTAYSGYAWCHTQLAQYVETEPEKKREHLLKAIEIAQRGKAYQKPGEPWTTCGHVLSKTMYFLARIETDFKTKSQLLNEALSISEEAVRVQKTLTPRSWNLGVMYNYLALVKAELSGLSPDHGKQIEFLQGAVSDMQQCLELCREVAVKSPSFALQVARYDEWYGDILVQLFHLTREANIAHRAVEAYENAIGRFARFEQTSPTAAVQWKIARIHDSTGSYELASQSFSNAARDYRFAAKKILGLSSAYGELASYMEAWSRIEDARLKHDGELYLQASENYGSAASTLQVTRTWNHLSSHYNACSLLERGEALGREEKHEASVEAFSSAVNGFHDAEAKLQNRIREGPESLEKDEMKEWLDITKGRVRYAQGRLKLEEARVLDKKGEEEESSKKYREANDVFKRLVPGAPNEQSRREIETLALFCEAWGKMKQAEVEASPQLYTEAAESFMRAKELTTRKRFRPLALANASLCKALEAGTMFRRTRDIQLYGQIKKQLESAADHYEQAGFKNATDWTRATQTMFDALAYMASAEAELEPKKKTEFYHLAQKHLELAARLYGEAGFQSKSEEALRYLKRVRQEREVLLTPAEVLAENPAVSGAVVAPVSLIRDQAVGLDKYESAQVVGYLSLHQNELGVGSDLTVELEVANVGKTAATLIKLENVVPKGFELDREKIPHRVEDNFIDMRGKRLEYLKTHEVKVPMRALTKGTFEIRPRILFVDDKGSYRSYDFEPAALTVRELGISGWLKGPGSK